MEKRITPEESLLIIANTIEETKRRFEENGYILILWGLLIFVVTLSQYILIQAGLAYRTGLPPLLYPPLGTLIFIYAWRRHKKNDAPKTVAGRILGAMGWTLGGNLMILGFFFWNRIGATPIPVFLILIAMFIIVTGFFIKFAPLVIGGILCNLLGFATFYLDWQYHPLVMSTASVISLIIPGILLNRDRRRGHV